MPHQSLREILPPVKTAVAALSNRSEPTVATPQTETPSATVPSLALDWGVGAPAAAAPVERTDESTPKCKFQHALFTGYSKQKKQKQDGTVGNEKPVAVGSDREYQQKSTGGEISTRHKSAPVTISTVATSAQRTANVAAEATDVKERQLTGQHLTQQSVQRKQFLVNGKTGKLQRIHHGNSTNKTTDAQTVGANVQSHTNTAESPETSQHQALHQMNAWWGENHHRANQQFGQFNMLYPLMNNAPYDNMMQQIQMHEHISAQQNVQLMRKQRDNHNAVTHPSLCAYSNRHASSLPTKENNFYIATLLGMNSHTTAGLVQQQRHTLMVNHYENQLSTSASQSEQKQPQTPGLQKPSKVNQNPIATTTKDPEIICSSYLTPAPLPLDPLDDKWDNTTLLEKEIAWLVEETAFISPPRTSTLDDLQLPIDVALVWKHGSLELRQLLFRNFPSEVTTVADKLKEGDVATHELYHTYCISEGESDQVLVDVQNFLSQGRTNEINRLRTTARQGLRFGFRRCDSLRRMLDFVLKHRRREALAEKGDDADDDDVIEPPKPKQSRHRRKLRITAQSGIANNELSVGNMEIIASRIPPDLTDLEDDVAWLAEESLMKLPEVKTTTSAREMKRDNMNQFEVAVSAGLVTQTAEIDWDYVSRHASDSLRIELERIGVCGDDSSGQRRRPHRILQRLVRYHDTRVRVAFVKRRDEIGNLFLAGFRREKTKEFLPSHELLVETGLGDIWKVRLSRRIHQNKESSREMATNDDLRVACSQRLDKPVAMSKKQQTTTVKKPQIIPQRTSVLTLDEEELAWVSATVAFDCK